MVDYRRAVLLFVCAWLTVLAASPGIAAEPSASKRAFREPFKAPAADQTVPPASVADGFTIAAAGDLIGPWRPRLALADPELERVAALVRGADVAFANLESNVFDLTAYGGYAAAESGGIDQGNNGGGPLLAAAVAPELKALGLDMLSTANNHALDWNVGGMFETIRNLDAAGLAHAGTGASRTAARAPAFVATPRGRIALVATASTVMPMAIAGPGGATSYGYVMPRPGVSALRHRAINLVTAQEFEAVRAIAARQGREREGEHGDVTVIPNEATFTGQTFRLSTRTGVTYELDASDRAEVLDAIRTAKRAADFAAFSIHAHETASGGQEHAVPPETLAPADFMQPLFHDAIDAGADAVFTHGPHVLRGIEIYAGKPIFYGLGSFFFELGAGWPVSWLDSVLAVCEYRGGRVHEIRLYPLDLGAPGAPARPRLQRGVPRLAVGEQADRILRELQRASRVYGTRIDIVDGVGVVHGDAR